MPHITLVIGYGAVGREIVKALTARGDSVTVAQRRRPADLPDTVAFVACDVLDPAATSAAIAGADQVVLATGFAYDARTWEEAWPRAMANVIDACEAADARLVYIDNLYQLGPQTEPVREDMPLTDHGRKPALRARITRQWMDAARGGRARIAALRAPDFYGPGVGLSHIGDTGFGRIAQGKAAMLLAPPDTPHDFAYVPDVARAAVSLLDAPDDAFGQVWNAPCAPTRTPREILELGARALDVPLKITAIPLWLLRPLGVFAAFLREVADVGFTWDRPYRVDSTKFQRRFWSDVTPFEIGAPASALSFARPG